MPISPWYVSQTHPILSLTWTDDAATPAAINLSGATVTVSFYTQIGNAALAGYGAGALSVTNAAGGLLTYAVTATDSGTAGTYYIVFKAVYGDGTILFSDPLMFVVKALG